MATTIDAQQLNPVIADILGLVENALEAARSANEKSAKLEREAAAPVVVLEKVAVSEDILTDTLDTLEASGYLDHSDRENVGKAVQADPSVALKIASRIAQLSATPEPQGVGVAKSVNTSAAERDPDGWLEVTKGKA